jgi:colicin import membrane protein
MHAAADRPEFAPPAQPGLLRSFVLAVLAHVLLVVALMHGLKWQRDAQDAGVEAELWASVPQEAAPKVAPPPPAPPAPPPVVKAPAQPQPEPPLQRDAQIAIEKQKREAEKKKQEELERERLEQRREAEARKKREEELAKKKLEQQKLAEAKKREEERKERLQQQAVLEEKKRQQLREENLRRMQGMAGTGAPSATGTAARSAGPSATWAGRVVARVRPNIVFTEPVSGNPVAEVEVRTSPDGTIVGKRLVRSSGVKAWDEAVLRALDKTETLPRDTDGRVPSPVVIAFKPRD